MSEAQEDYSEGESILTLIYAVADALDVAAAIRSEAAIAKVEGARALLQASFAWLLRSALAPEDAASRLPPAGLDSGA